MTSASTVACVSLALLMAGGASPPPDVRPVRTIVAKADVDSTAADRGHSHFVVLSTCDRVGGKLMASRNALTIGIVRVTS